MMTAAGAFLVAVALVGLPSTLAFASPRTTRARTTTSSYLYMSSSALIVQNKGGGHGELGYQLAKNLSTNPKISSITILQDSAASMSKEPFASYSSDLPNVKIIMADLNNDSMTAEDMSSLLDGTAYDYIWDNSSKGDVGAGKAVIDCAAKIWKSKLLAYVSSAGIYKSNGVFPMPETTSVKDTAGQVLYEKYALESKLPFVSFRPQYIYGRNSNKWDYIDWYFDRIIRNLPLPIPGDGTQKVSLTNSEDVAALLASVLTNEKAAVEQTFFNCGTDRLVTYDEVANLCAKVARKDLKIQHYDAVALGKGTFPFRPANFYVAPTMAMSKLGWRGSSRGLEDDLGWYYESYLARGGAIKEMTFEEDIALIVA